MSTVESILNSIAEELAADLAPLNSVHHNFARFKVEATFEDAGLCLHVYAPDHCRIFVPKVYNSFPVIFHEWDDKSFPIDFEIDITGITHNIYA